MDIDQESTIPITTSPKMNTESNNNESAISSVSDRPSTPDKCAVCLNIKQMDIIARIDSCGHTFCFACILEWSKVRPICPLCKQAFKLITRERYSGEIVEEVRVQTTQPGTSRRFNNLNEVLTWVDQHRRDRPTDRNYPPRHRPQDLFRQMVYMEWLNTVQALVHRPNANSQNNYLTPFVRGTNAINLTDLIPADSIRRLLARYLRQTTSELRQSTVYSQSTRQTVAFRKYIYLNRVFVKSPLVGHNRDRLTVRECSPTWFASNPACLHRLVPFLARELIALLWNDERTIEHIIQEILTTIQIHEIRSTVLTRKLNDYLGRYTKHFIHEFHTFAACPYDLAGFDRYAEYPNINAPAEGTTPLQIQIDDDDDEEMPIVIEETSDISMNLMNPVSSSSSSTAVQTASVSEQRRRSSSPECEIVDYVQAVRERSPTLIVLSEDDENNEDEDVDLDNDHQNDDDDDDDDSQQDEQETATSRKRKHRYHHHQSKRTNTAVSNQRSPESVILDDQDHDDDDNEEEPEHIESFPSQTRRTSSSSPTITTTSTTTTAVIYETDED